MLGVREGLPAPDETWEGIGISEQDAKEMALRCGFRHRYSYGAGTAHFWVWFFKPASA
jgi:hypothetical protein